MIVLCQGVRGGRSSPQVKAGSITVASGAYGALSRSSKERSACAVAELVAEQLVGPLHVAADQLGIRVEHDLVGVEPVPLGRLERPVDAVAVELAGQHVGQVGVPDLVGVLLQRDAVRLLGRRPASRTGRARPWWRSRRRARN